MADVQRPEAIFITHGHYDHIMDTIPAIRAHEWGPVAVFGNETAGHILSAYGNAGRWTFHDVAAGNDWQPTGLEGLRFIALPAEHAPQVGRHLLFSGALTSPPRKPPTKARDFLEGQTHAYLFEIRHGDIGYRVFFAGTAGPVPAATLKELARRAPVDVAILSAPSWKKARGYPAALVRALRPRYLVPAHFNDLFADYDSRRVLAAADLDGFVAVLQEAASGYQGFQSVIVPDLNTPVRVSRR